MLQCTLSTVIIWVIYLVWSKQNQSEYAHAHTQSARDVHEYWILVVIPQQEPCTHYIDDSQGWSRVADECTQPWLSR